MHERIVCPDCRRALHLPRDCAQPWLPCPNCAARIRNPQAERVAEEGINGGHRCPTCGEQAESYWLFCPHCEEPLHDPLQRSSGVTNLDGGQKGGRAEHLLGLLAMFGLVGITIAFVYGLTLILAGKEAPLVTLLAVLWVLAGVSTAIVFSSGRRSDRSAARVVMVTLSLVGVLTVGGCLLSAAGFTYLLAVCLAR